MGGGGSSGTGDDERDRLTQFQVPRSRFGSAVKFAVGSVKKVREGYGKCFWSGTG